ncbi:MAG: hypothetical protein ABSC89_13865 [Verrucomicrobiota bacterium]|jgi:hypothetical protein
MNENIYDRLQAHEQAKLNAAGLSDVKFTIGWFRVGDNLRLEARLAGPPASQKKARELLSFSGQNEARPHRRQRL